ncbi:hypothetical protein HPP92_002697 [Vanilla planifolia]|uniref:Uncharacterized protein n=1 Tax=Vanilla planifolia TaxID=51239 RepID=A0A835RTG8_VANPL|nr:hypothetical protein HPP92_002697 [Vanilla planifolia]
MQRFVGKHTPRKFVIALSCVVLCSLGLFVDNLWKSSWQMSPHSASSLWSSGIDMGLASACTMPRNTPFEWEEMPSAPVPGLDGASDKLKNLLYVFAGYGTIDFDSHPKRTYMEATKTKEVLRSCGMISFLLLAVKKVTLCLNLVLLFSSAAANGGRMPYRMKTTLAGFSNAGCIRLRAARQGTR